MKNSLLLLCIIFFTLSFFAQSGALKPGPVLTKMQGIKLKDKIKTNASHSKINSTSSGWFNYGVEAENFYFSSSTITGSYLFPDSMGYANFGGATVAPIWVHHVAELVDFNSIIFSGNQATSWLSTATSPVFYIDSMSMVYGYSRNHPDPTIVDTLIITLFDNSSPFNLQVAAVTTPVAMNYGVDTFSYQKIGYNPSENIICAPSATTSPQLAPAGQYTFKILLTQGDSTVTSISEKKFRLPVPFSSSRGNLVVADVMFKPGYTYTLTQEIDLTANAFVFASREENGSATFMNHTDCNYGSSLCDYSMSYILPKYNRYNIMPAYWNYRYNPSIAYTNTYGYEHHMISFHLTEDLNYCIAEAQFSITPDSLNPGIYNAYESSTGTGPLSYLWDFGDNTTSNLHYPSHQYAVPGQYVVCLTVSAASGTNTCTDTYCDSSSVQRMASGFVMSQFNVIDPMIVTGVKQIENTTYLSAFPNPVTDELIIQNTNLSSPTLNYILTDALGRIVFSGHLQTERTSLNSSKLAKGFYNLQFTNTNGNLLKTIKLIK